MEYLAEFPDAGQMRSSGYLSPAWRGPMDARIMGDIPNTRQTQDDWAAANRERRASAGWQGQDCRGPEQPTAYSSSTPTLGRCEQHVAEVQQDAQQGGAMDFDMLKGLQHI